MMVRYDGPRWHPEFAELDRPFHWESENQQSFWDEDDLAEDVIRYVASAFHAQDHCPSTEALVEFCQGVRVSDLTPCHTRQRYEPSLAWIDEQSESGHKRQLGGLLNKTEVYQALKKQVCFIKPSETLVNANTP
jgi:hypothetical protein